jgi:hypothetical protein
LKEVKEGANIVESKTDSKGEIRQGFLLEFK